MESECIGGRVWNHGRPPEQASGAAGAAKTELQYCTRFAHGNFRDIRGVSDLFPWDVWRVGVRQPALYLESPGQRIVDCNWRCSEGEIDIVALAGDALWIAEVKSGKFLAHGV
ncbi:YraN family protein [Arthrobacter nitrophenolicus]|uniref:Uncharacterized protein n=1 Tax=Arthrobacter nitrophenolicus TaxID=683150 RepID=A0A4R5XR54_9MICC|nr:hypothetical protein E2R57_16180 [Arthrobacter nitrophenolicus]